MSFPSLFSVYPPFLQCIFPSLYLVFLPFFYVSFPLFTLSFSLSLKQLFHFSIFSVFPYLFTYLQYIFPSFLFSSLYFSLLSKENIQLSSLNLPTPFYSMYVYIASSHFRCSLLSWPPSSLTLSHSLSIVKNVRMNMATIIADLISLSVYHRECVDEHGHYHR